MKLNKTLLAAALVAVIASGCKKEAEPVDAAAAETAANAPDIADAAEAADAPAGTTAFDLGKVPLSDKALGAFPFLTIPTGYSNEGRRQGTMNFARFPFWVDGKAHWIEGKLYGTSIAHADGATFSQYEMQRNVEAMVEQMGGVQVSVGKIPYDTIKSWGDEILTMAGFGDVYNLPATTYLVRRNEGNIWINYVSNASEAWWIVVQEEGFKQTAQLLPASELKQRLDSAGKVALQVNFATDKTDILPASQPQIDQVVQLLNGDASLKLAINGHTDNTGDDARNQTLSQGRAQAVVSAITAKGIDAGRLQARGFGDSQPVADNGTEDGKASNRRVELVKQ